MMPSGSAWVAGDWLASTAGNMQAMVIRARRRMRSPEVLVRVTRSRCGTPHKANCRGVSFASVPQSCSCFVSSSSLGRVRETSTVPFEEPILERRND